VTSLVLVSNRQRTLATWLLALSVALGAGSGCTRREREAPRPEPVVVRSASPVPVPASLEPVSPRPKSCAERIAEVVKQPGLSGAPGFEAKRQWLLLNAKAEPLFFVATPEFTESPSVPGVGRDRALLQRTEHSWDVIGRLLERFKQAPREGRETLLRDGYLYTEDPEQAFALVNQVGAEHLFGHDMIWLQRGAMLYHAKRSQGRYVFSDGPNKGEPVRLLLLDRVGTGEPPKRQLARDFRALSYKLHFTGARVTHITEEHLVAELEYDSEWVPSLLRAHGAVLELECEIPALTPLPTWREQASRRQRVVQGLRSVILEAVAEQLPFDEPRREWGVQLDGKLRSNWQHAYERGKPDFGINGDLYPVFDAKGRPLVPEVCVDFLTDTLERFSGNWFRPKGQVPGRTPGKLSLVPSDLIERAKFRRVPDFVGWAQVNVDKFEVLNFPEVARVPLGDREGLLAQLDRQRRDLLPGDVVIIRGPTPWDPTEMHYHSFFIFENDPMTGRPLVVVGNAGRPTVRAWETEIRRTPERWLQHRLRPTTQWLESIISDTRPDSKDPVPLSPVGNAG